MHSDFNFQPFITDTKDMKTLIATTLLFLPLITSAELKILDGGEKGPTFMDPVNFKATVNVSQTVPGQLAAKYSCPAPGPDGKPANNLFLVKREDDNCDTQDIQQVGTGLSCEGIKKEDPRVFDCQAFSALEVNLTEPTGTPGPAFTSNVDVNLNTPEIKKDIETCSPGHNFVVIRDTKSNKGVLASMKDKSYCSLEKKKISFDYLNDQGSEKQTGVYSSYMGGFYVGNHTHYYFDKDSKSWCKTFEDPDRRKKSCSSKEAPKGIEYPTCGFTNVSFNIDFDVNPDPGVKDIRNRGVVELTVGADGIPVAYVGRGVAQAGQNAQNGNPKFVLDKSKPMLKVLVNHKENGTRTTSFQAIDSVNGAVHGTLTMSPQHTFGSEFSKDTAVCSANTCLRTPSAILAANSSLDQKSCTKNPNPIDLKDNSQTQCYSCNGVTPGACSDTMDILTPALAQTTMQKMNACQQNNISPTLEAPAAITPTAQ